MKKVQINNLKSDTKPINYDTILTHVINGCKCRIPISKTLKKYDYNRSTFYTLSNAETITYLNELKSLTRSRRGVGCSSTYRRSDTANFNIFEDD